MTVFHNQSYQDQETAVSSSPSLDCEEVITFRAEQPGTIEAKPVQLTYQPLDGESAKAPDTELNIVHVEPCSEPAPVGATPLQPAPTQVPIHPASLPPQYPMQLQPPATQSQPIIVAQV